tara:strand:+ start:27578 stop:27697 length:120 start_codon:yes stop_codon:yes gene_type:complete
MKENTWEECIQTSASIKITADLAKVRSLIDTAKGRNNFL